MKKIVFTFGGKRLEVDLENEFAQFVLDDIVANRVDIEKENETSQLLSLYLTSLHREYNKEEHIKILINQIESSNK